MLRPCSKKWYEIGLHLGIGHEELDSMVQSDLTSEQLLHETLKLKLKSGEEVTWGDVVIALLAAGEDDLAQQVATANSGG